MLWEGRGAQRGEAERLGGREARSPAPTATLGSIFLQPAQPPQFATQRYFNSQIWGESVRSASRRFPMAPNA